MKLERGRLLNVAALTAALGVLVDCGSDGNQNGPTTTTVTLTAPGLVEPAPGTAVGTNQPTLIVSNANVSNGSTPTYTFQVATDAGFATIVAQQSGVAQGNGQTSWQVTVELQAGEYFWRARASAAGVQGPFSPNGSFSVGGVVPSGQVVLFDPLTNGSTLAIDRSGGEFTDRGWRVTSNSDFLRYEVDAISSGFVQWQNVGLTPRGFNDDSTLLFGMWDPSAGGYRANPYRVHVQKLWNNPHNPPFIRLRWIAGGELHDGGFNFTDWDPGVTYTWRLEWGPEEGANTAKLFLDDQEIIQVRYGRQYLPNTHWIEFGVQERNESVIDAVYKNIRIGTR